MTGIIQALRYAIVATTTLACSSADVQCIVLPCPPPEAVTINVLSDTGSAGIANLTMTVSGAVTGSGPCTQAGTTVCHVLGGAGTYHVQLSAPGYKPVQVDFTVTGTAGGCNSCPKVDTKIVAVKM
ncbi:MAG TPA: hypothetical protein VF929_03960, partial [Gemmatimonadaceae bacterium]